MEDSLKQALADFELFLAGSRAPALIGHSLATVVGQDVRVVATAVSRWVYASPNATYDRFTSLLLARNKVFDVFFYRVVRFQRIYEFFPPFERALVRAVPQEDQAQLATLLEKYPWKEIRPLGSFRDPQEFAWHAGKCPILRERENEGQHGKDCAERERVPFRHAGCFDQVKRFVEHRGQVREAKI